ncbi:hypothetical protein BVRB_5g112750 [Beta vulgaris subsp. vulgaris]|nr:hypothetical protein BVRB_5g112750 [Beta vulgaris subsp. vulgaris]
MTSKIHKNVVSITCSNFKIQPPKYLSLFIKYIVELLVILSTNTVIS